MTYKQSQTLHQLQALQSLSPIVSENMRSKMIKKAIFIAEKELKSLYEEIEKYKQEKEK